MNASEPFAPESPTCETLDRLAARVQCRLIGRVRDFRLAVRDGTLILHGRAFTYHAKQLAQHAVMEATCQLIGANEIEVTSSGSAHPVSLE